jgi:polyisoprenoid-binding protein YceI
MVSKVRGSFKEFEGKGYFDAEEPERSSLEVTIAAASIDTGDADRDEHLRSNDFFAMETYPTIHFVSTTVVQNAEGRYTVHGNLTIKGVTRPVGVDLVYTGSAIDPFGNERIGFEGRSVVNRKDWGVNWNTVLEAGGVLVGERVVLEFDVSAIRNP